MPCFVLHFGKQNGLAPQARRAADPVALGQLADHFGMGVLGNLAYEIQAVLIRHPVAWLDLFFLRDDVLEASERIGGLRVDHEQTPRA